MRITRTPHLTPLPKGERKTGHTTRSERRTLLRPYGEIQGGGQAPNHSASDDASGTGQAPNHSASDDASGTGQAWDVGRGTCELHDTCNEFPISNFTNVSVKYYNHNVCHVSCDLVTRLVSVQQPVTCNLNQQMRGS